MNDWTKIYYPRIFSAKYGQTANAKPHTAVCRPILYLKVSNIRLKTKNVQTSAQVTLSRISAPAVVAKGVFERRTSTGSEAFSFLICHDATKLFMLILYSYRDDLTENIEKPLLNVVDSHCQQQSFLELRSPGRSVFNLIMKWLLGSNLSQLQLSTSLSLMCRFVFHCNDYSFSIIFNGIQ